VPPAPELSIIIAARNARSTIAEQLDALLAQSWSGTWDIVVVDNGSTDGTDALVETYTARDARVRLTRAPGAQGAGAVRNAGVARTDAAGFAMCDADDIVAPTWVAAMGNGLRAHDCVTGPLEVRSLNPAWLARTRGIPALDQPMTFHGCFPLLPAGNFAMRRDLWQRLGGFDESMRTHEDADLALRHAITGGAVQFDPAAMVAYRYRGEPSVLFRQARAYGRFRPLIARRARAAGMQVPRLAGWKSWALLVAWLPRLRSSEGRAAYAWVAGARLGMLEGSIRARTLYL
jgi:glycosyltransferase involved in cell wall biosynthesis